MMQRAGVSMADVFASLEKARSACKEAGLDRLRRDYERPPAHDMSECSDDDKRTTYARAKAGQMGPAWRRLAHILPIGSWLMLYEDWHEAPTDDQLRKHWPDWKP